MKKRKVAITADIGLDQELIAKLFEIHHTELLVIPTNLSLEHHSYADNKNAKYTKCETFELLKEVYLKQVQKQLNSCDGILLPGNKYDIDPIHYGETVVHQETQKKINSNPEDIRFEVEKTMLLYAVEMEIPIVAICGGMQLVNVVFGGKLSQHLPDSSTQMSHRIEHEIKKEAIEKWKREFKNHVLTGHSENIYNQHPHRISIDKRSKIGKIYHKYNPAIDLDNVYELSIHHQGICKENLAPNLRVVATSEDGIIEAIELIDYPSLFVATQFHFEYNVGNVASGIIKELIS